MHIHIYTYICIYTYFNVTIVKPHFWSLCLCDFVQLFEIFIGCMLVDHICIKIAHVFLRKCRIGAKVHACRAIRTSTPLRKRA